MTKPFVNPFVEQLKSKDDRDKVLEQFIDFLKEKAASFPIKDNIFYENNTDWLMDKLEEMLDQDDWDRDEIVRISAITFFLATVKQA